ncbi:DNA ligase D [Oceanobacillus halotolerans]|uniref:DNA ligase D n=1 Tax=Oceanobacillus halotolerans TaxID=2663380 RepID=UPI00299D50E6|nr:DNA ligase D [Oceanobacillus halotolerans]
MKPIATAEIPKKPDEWMYEVKYDGFRGVLYWDKASIRLISKNGHDLTANFPEIVTFCQEIEHSVEPHLPLVLDGEIAILNNPYQANFAVLQQRGRLKNTDSINKAAEKRPAHFCVFDLLQQNGNSLQATPYMERKAMLETLLVQTLPETGRLRYVPTFSDAQHLWGKVFIYKGEGMIAKRKNSTYHAGKKHHDWMKLKNWRTIQGFITFYDPKNNYFTINVFENETIKPIGKCKHGLSDEEMGTLSQLFRTKGEKRENGFYLPPAICASIHTLDLYKGELREPEFAQLVLKQDPQTCTKQQLQLDMAMLPSTVEATNTDKVFWPEKGLTKGDLLTYIREIAPYMLPFLENRALTVIRCPDGVTREHFFQKHLPDYAPNFINRFERNGETFIVCDRLDTLVWFANHGAIEYHVPFQQINSSMPNEIVFDLDPPSRNEFSLAIKAATLIKQLLDDLGLTSFVKLSGNKGLQIYIPLPKESMTYDDTAVFTQAIAWTVENAHPTLFTTERFKDKRNGRLYIDYVQHGKDKTIIAPYSPRKTNDATVAAPLFWEEVNNKLRPEQFTIKNVVDRVQTDGCPFKKYREAANTQPINAILQLIKK